MIALSPELLTIIIYILSALSLTSLILIIVLWTRIKRLTRGSKGSLDAVIGNIGRDVDNLLKFKDDATNYFIKLNKESNKSIKDIPVKIFKAFDGLDSGGKNSFVTAFVNKEGDGVLLSALHSRDRINIYAKEVIKWKTDRMLTEEEEELLTNTRKSRNI